MISFILICYGLKPLESDNKTTLILSNTRELNKELFCKLVYLIVLQMVHTNYCAPYPKQPCGIHVI